MLIKQPMPSEARTCVAVVHPKERPDEPTHVYITNPEINREELHPRDREI